MEVNIEFKLPGTPKMIAIIAQLMAKGGNPKQVAALIKRATNSAVSSTAYGILKSVKDAIKKNRFGWDPYKAHPEHLELYARVLRRFGRTNKRTKASIRSRSFIKQTPGERPWARMSRVLLYKVDKDTSSAKIGVIPGFRRTGAYAERLVDQLQKGSRKTINPKMRKLFAAVGLPIGPDTTELVSPERPLVDAVYQKDAEEISRTLQEKFLKRLFSY